MTKENKKKRENKGNSKRKVLVTSALPYVNNVPHLGNLVCVISGDVFTRFLKLKEREVISVLGTDEHGTTTEVKAKEEGLTPKELVDKYFKIHKEIYEWFQCNYSCFGRTSDKANHITTKHIFEKLYENGFIFEKEVEQPFCETCNMFLADRFIIGTCPYCGYEKARGDQCDNCSKLLDPKDLINPMCKFCGSTPIWKKTKHLYLDLEKLQPMIEEWFNKKKEHWSLNAITMTKAMLEQGLKPRAITRDLEWGISVPLKGYEKKVFYSWFDAPIGYISIVRAVREDWKEWWMNPEEVELVQFMGKDNIPFHTTMFPGMLLGTKENWTTLDRISANEYLNYEGGKFSKSLNRGVFGDDAISTGIKSDVWRFYLMINRPEKTDTNFSWRDLQEKVNKELIGNIGNLFHRVLLFYYRNFDHEGEVNPEDIGQLAIIKEVDTLMEEIELKKALRKILEIGVLGNKYFQENKPWELIKENKEETKKVLQNLLGLIRDLSIVLWPFMPATMQELWDIMGIDKQKWKSIGTSFKISLKEPKVLFVKLEDEKINEFLKKYGGGEMEGKEEKSKEMNETEPFSLLDLRVAEVLEVRDHPNADKLYILKIALGDEERQLVAGLKGYYNKEELLGKHLIVVTNLKPAKLRGELSEGMLLAAVSDENVGILMAPNSSPGEKVFVEDIPYSPKSEITIQEFLKVGLRSKDGKAYYKDKPLKTAVEEILVDKNIDGEIR